MRPRSLPARAAAIAVVAAAAGGALALPARAETDQVQARMLFNRGVERATAGEHLRAIVEFNRAIDNYPQYADAYTARALAWTELGHLGRAMADYDEAIRLNPQHFAAHANRSTCRRRLGDLDGALADIRVADELHADNALIAAQLGDLLLATGDLDGAQTALERAVGLAPSLVPAHVHLGITRARQGAYDDALERFAGALELDPGHVLTWRHRAVARRDHGDLDGALEDLDAAIDRDPVRADLHFLRGMLLYDLQRYDDALPAFRRRCELDPEHQEEARLFIWLTLAAAGYRETGAADLADFIAQRPGPAEAPSPDDWFAVRSSFLLGDLGAAGLLEAAAAGGEGRLSQAHFYIGSVQLIEGRAAEAGASLRECLVHATADSVESPCARAALHRLEPVTDADIATGVAR